MFPIIYPLTIKKLKYLKNARRKNDIYPVRKTYAYAKDNPE